MPWWRDESLGDLLGRWSRLGQILERPAGADEQALADALLQAARVGRAPRSHPAADSDDLPDQRPEEPQAVAVEGEIWDGQDRVTVACVLRMSWQRAQALARLLGRWTKVAALVDEGGGSDESVLAAELQAAIEQARSRGLGRARPARAVLDAAHELGQRDPESGGEGVATDPTDLRRSSHRRHS